MPFLTEGLEGFSIDYPDDWALAERLVASGEAVLPGGDRLMEAAGPRAARADELRYVPPAELERLRALDADPVARAAAFADACRINALYMIMRGRLGPHRHELQRARLLVWLHLEVLEERRPSTSPPRATTRPALYAVLIGLGRLDFDLHPPAAAARRPARPPRRRTPRRRCVTNTGSLGMGISKAQGFVARRPAARAARRRVFVLTGDGELQEGQFWESLAARPPTRASARSP